MAFDTKATISKLVRAFLDAINDRDIQRISELDGRVQTLLSNPSLDRKAHQSQLVNLKKVHEQAYKLVLEETSLIRSRMDSFSDNQDGLRGYFEVMNQE